MLIVPTEEDAAAGLVLAGIARSGIAEPDAEAIPEFVVYDDIPNLVESPPAITPSGMPTAIAALDEDGSRPPMVESNRAGPPRQRRGRVPEPGVAGSLLLVSRRVLYFRARPTASRVASYTAVTSMPSTVTPGAPYPWARTLMSSTAVERWALKLTA